MVKQATDTPEVARTTMTAVSFVLGAVLLLCGATVLLVRRREARRARIAANAADPDLKNGKQVEMKTPPVNGSTPALNGTNASKAAEADDNIGV